MKKYLLIFFLVLVNNQALADVTEKIIQNLTDTNNISFNFEQNINGKVEMGNCIIQYPKKIYCDYNSSNEKLLISNGNSLVLFLPIEYLSLFCVYFSKSADCVP